MPYLGERAGLLTSLFFAITAVISTAAGATVGSVVLNRTRVVFALVYLLLLNTILFRQPLPIAAAPTRWIWLALSGVIGLAIGDAFLFQAYLSIGPRLGSLLLSLSTVFGALEAWIFFGESLRVGQVVGIGLALAGIMWVVLERAPRSPAPGSGLPAAVLAPAGELTNADSYERPRPSATGILF